MQVLTVYSVMHVRTRTRTLSCLSACKICTAKLCILQYYLRHSCSMPPDRKFGCIEKTLRKTESIVSPAEYHEIFKDHGQLLHWGIERKLYDFQTSRYEFAGIRLKYFVGHTSHPNEVGRQTVYKQDQVFTSYLKKGRKLSELGTSSLIQNTKSKEAKNKDAH